ncbi:TAXI family TRAP transporter solute-binding subunit [Ornithinibacillus massiliensis]|uniref:TAXI family TRAP transporter solute-binding subunit n=1 Tax=Ornithinibacillus massiliensis TaxID=1944633 RepID=A0ABS5MGU8_9BACI|nr:TAXI family TRAP transporter solute-binding subunit [Ornithinibacillus massiliensis]MBS3681567.1 TAXI family TRAP transporter solute-binding subunit [Ornithinibacillus massiliensis]
MKKTIFFSMFLSLVLVLGACGDSTGGTGDNALDGEFVTVLTGGSSGVYYPLGGAMAKIYQDMGANANSQSTAASSANITTLNKGDAEIGFSMGDAAADGYEGIDSFEEQGAQENIRSIASLYPNYLQIVATVESGIKTVEDLAGKSVAVGAPASGTEISAKRVLEAYGMSYDDINEDYLSFAEGVEGIKNGTIDAVVISSGLPNAGVMELQTTNDIVVVEIAEDKVLEMQEKYPAFFPAVVAADVYDLDADTPTIGVNNVLLTHKDVSDDVAYALTKGIYENLDTLKDTHNAAKDIDIQNALQNLPAPLHPGAKKYFDEQGITE